MLAHLDLHSCSQQTLYCYYDGQLLFYILLFQNTYYIHACAGFEFHDNFLIIDRDFLNQPANQLLIVFSDGAFFFL